MKYTVCISVYGKSPFLKEQIDSIINQSIPPSEIVVVEDKSNVSAKDYIKKYLSNSGVDYKILVNTKNLGPAKSFKKAILASGYDYIYLSDQDDIWNKNRVLYTIEYLKDHFLVACNAQVFYSDGRPVHKLYYNNDFNDLSIFKLFYKNIIVGATLCINLKNRRHLFNAFNFDPMHDWTLSILSILEKEEIKFVDKKLISYRRHDQTYTGINKNSIFKKISFRFLILFFILRYKLYKLIGKL